MTSSKILLARQKNVFRKIIFPLIFVGVNVQFMKFPQFFIQASMRCANRLLVQDCMKRDCGIKVTATQIGTGQN